MINRKYVKIKSIKKNTRLIDTYFMGKYSFSPYMACAHGCKYCDGRSERYYIEGDFEKNITIRKNIPEILDKTLKKAREKGFILIGSGVSDPYQPLEKEENIMKDSSKIILKHKFPASLMTKSSLPLRDINIYDKINKDSSFILMVSIALTNENDRKILEPGASPLKERLTMLSEFKKKNINTIALMMPLLPGISDDKKSVIKLVKALKDLKIDAIMPGLLTLRPGKQKDFYMNIIKEYYPTLHNIYENIYSENKMSGSPNNKYASLTSNSIYSEIKSAKIPTMIPHKCYKGSYQIYDEIYILLHHMKNIYKYKNIDIRNLNKIISTYKSWLLKEKIYFNKKRSLHPYFIEEKIISELKKESSTIFANNKKINLFLRNYVLGDNVFDYTR